MTSNESLFSSDIYSKNLGGKVMNPPYLFGSIALPLESLRNSSWSTHLCIWILISKPWKNNANIGMILTRMIAAILLVLSPHNGRA